MSAFGTQPAFQVVGGLSEIGGAAEVAPIVVVGAEGEDFFALGGEAEVGGDDGEDAFFGEHGEEAGGDDVDAGEGESMQRTACVGWGKSRFLALLGMTIRGYFGGLQRRWFRGLGKWFRDFWKLFRGFGKWRVA